jgi:hypothetical protein
MGAEISRAVGVFTSSRLLKMAWICRIRCSSLVFVEALAAGEDQVLRLGHS